MPCSPERHQKPESKLDAVDLTLEDGTRSPCIIPDRDHKKVGLQTSSDPVAGWRFLVSALESGSLPIAYSPEKHQRPRKEAGCRGPQP